MDALDWYVLSVLFGNKMALSVWTITLAISNVKNACFLLAPRSMNKTTIFLHIYLTVSSLFEPVLSTYVTSLFISHMLTCLKSGLVG